MIFYIVIAAISLYALHRQAHPKRPQLPPGTLVPRGQVQLAGWDEHRAECRRLLEASLDARDAYQTRVEHERRAKFWAKYERDNA